MAYTRDDLTTDFQYTYDAGGWDFTKDLKLKTHCVIPFRTVLVDSYGDTYICNCQAWLPICVGKIFEFTSFQEVLESPKAKELQQSIIDKSYRYCNTQMCNYADNGNDTIPRVGVQNVIVAIDKSCNFTCPSCREKHIFQYKGPEYDNAMKIAMHVGMMISNEQRPLHIAFGDGEFFASHVYKQLCDSMDVSKHRVKIITNGSLIQDNWKNVQHFENSIVELSVSVDAGSETIYSKVRRGGNWDKLLSNLKWFNDYRTALPTVVNLSFCVQTKNYTDIENFANICENLNVNGYLYPIQDWGTWHDFNEHAIWKSTHPLNADLKAQLNKVSDKITIHKGLL